MKMQFNILTFGRLAEEFKAAFNDFTTQQNFTLDHIENVDQQTLDRYNAIAAFSVPMELNISHIKWIHSFGAGVDAFINRTDLASDVIITRTIGKLGERIAEYCLAHSLAYKQHIYETYASQLTSEWKQRAPIELKNSRIAVIGTGNMGRAAAQFFNALGAETLGINRDGHHESEFSQCIPLEQIINVDRPDPIVTGIDSLISTLPNAPGTKEILKLDFFSQFHAVHFINVGRGSVVKEETIIAAIEKGYLSRATLDVFETEPLPESSLLWKNPRVFITPHQASLTDIGDVKVSFVSAYKTIQENKINNLFVELDKGY